MIKDLKIQTALIICAVFVFRILYVNLYLPQVSDSPLSKNRTKSHLSTILKKRRMDHLESALPGGCAIAILATFVQNESREGNPTGLNPFNLLKLIYLFIEGPSKDFHYRSFASSIYPCRYLALQVFRL